MKLGALFSSEFDDWCTPSEVLDRVRLVDEIGLDPFSNAQSIVGAKRDFRLDRGEDALRLDWRGHGLVFCNPPYGDDIAPCMRRVAYFAAEGVEIIALLPHRTDTQWWQSTSGAAGKCEWEGRLKHPRGVSDKRQLRLVGVAHIEEAYPPPDTGTAPFPSVVVYWGDRFKRFERAFADAGQIWQRVERRARRRAAK